jgi:hypothetical protein
LYGRFLSPALFLPFLVFLWQVASMGAMGGTIDGSTTGGTIPAIGAGGTIPAIGADAAALVVATFRGDTLTLATSPIALILWLMISAGNS